MTGGVPEEVISKLTTERRVASYSERGRTGGRIHLRKACGRGSEALWGTERRCVKSEVPYFLLIKKLWMSKEKKKNEVERLSRGWIAQGCGNHFESNTKPSAMLRAVPSKMVV